MENLSEYQLVRIGDKYCPKLRNFVLQKGKTTLGRSVDCSIVTYTTFASRVHCRIQVDEAGSVRIEDEASMNGTFVNAVCVDRSKEIFVGDVIGIGCSVIDPAVIEKSPSLIVYELKRLDSGIDTVQLESDSETDDPADVVVIDSDIDVPSMNAPSLEQQQLPVPDRAASSSPPGMLYLRESSLEIEASLSPEPCDEVYSNQQWSQQMHSEMRAEVCAFDERIIDHQYEVENERAASTSPPGMLFLRQSSPEKNADVSPPMMDVDLHSDSDSEFDASARGNNRLECVDMTSIDISDAEEDENDVKLSGWIKQLNQNSDHGFRTKTETADDDPIRAASAEDVVDENDDDENDIEQIQYNTKRSNSLDASESPKRLCQVGIKYSEQVICWKANASEAKEETSVTIQAASIDPAASDRARNPEECDESTAAPPTTSVEPTRNRLENFLKRRQSLSERPIQMINALPQMQKRRQSICEDRPKSKPLEKTKKAIKIVERRHSFYKNETSSSSSTHKKSATDEQRKAKLKELAENSKKPFVQTVRINATPKIKLTSNNRGSFLADIANVPLKPCAVKRKKKTCIASSCSKAKTTTVSNTMATCKEATEHNIPTMDATENHEDKSSEDLPINIPMESAASVCPDDDQFANELATYSVRIAPIPQNVRPILRSGNSVRPRRSIRFAINLCAYRDFFKDPVETDENNTAMPEPTNAPIATPVNVPGIIDSNDSQREIGIRKIRDIGCNSIHTIVQDITRWNPDWLNGPPDEPNVNHSSYQPVPMLHNYSDYSSYLKIVVPIMKMELWQNIYNAYNISATQPLQMCVTNVSSLMRNGGMLFVFKCQLSAPDVRLYDDYLVLVSYSFRTITYKFLGIITQRRTVPGDSLNHMTTVFTVETSSVAAKALTPATPIVQIQSVCNLRVDLKHFTAILQLDTSPLFQQVLRPSDHPIRLMNSMDSMPYEYRGADQLNAEQALIVRQICYRWAQRNGTITLVDGPPGTGKSRLITNLLVQFHRGYLPNRPRKMLLCAHSNAAVDLICRRLQKILEYRKRTGVNFKIVRFGVPESMHPAVRPVSLNYLAKQEIQLNDLQKEQMLMKQKIAAKRISSGNPVKIKQEEMHFKRQLRLVEDTMSWKQSRRDNNGNITEAERKANEYHLGTADIICTTLSSCVNIMRYIQTADICIVDEATQCTEPSTLLPLQLGVRSLVLVGDTQQLPGTVLSRPAAELGLSKSLFDRVQGAFVRPEQCPTFRLNRQYRMHADICSWPNRFFYGGQLETVEPALASEAQGSANGCVFPLRPYNVFSLHYSHSERRVQYQHHMSNANEADFVVRLLHVLAKIVTSTSTVGVITPYAGQRDELNAKIKGVPLRFVTVDTIDAYQGQEKDIIIMSTTRSNGIGFLQTGQRLNVALTRARKCMILCGNFNSLRQNEMWNSLLTDASERNCYKQFQHTDDDAEFKERIIEHLVKDEFKAVVRLNTTELNV